MSDNFIKKLWRNSLTRVSKLAVLYYLILGIVMILVGFNNLLGESFSHALEVTGTTIISGSVFVSIIKSKQFTEIFKEQLHDIVYCENHFNNRKDIPQIWEKASKALYNDKFPELSNNLEETLKKYLPISSTKYFENYEYKIDISFDTEHLDYINLKEEENFTIKAENTSSTDYTSSAVFNKSSNNDLISFYQLLDFKVNGKSSMPNNNEFTVINNNTEAKIIAKHKRSFTGKKEYLIEKQEWKRYSLKNENTKSHTCRWIFNNYKMEIIHPKELEVKFYENGTLGNFNIKLRDIGNNLRTLTCEYKGIMLPSQGVRLIFRDRRN